MVGMLRGFLERLYVASAYAAGGFIILIAVFVLLQVVGRWWGVVVPSTEDFAGYCLASATFFGLAYTFRRHKHIRVVVLLHALPARGRWWAETLALVLLLVVASYLAYSIGFLVYESWAFDELSQGYIAVPLFAVQSGMLAGQLVFVVAVADSLVARLLVSHRR